jgi:hypothetical protein
MNRLHGHVAKIRTGENIKTIIAGSRSMSSYELLTKIIDSCPFKFEITEVVSGTAKGVDKLGEEWAKHNKIPIKQFQADWDKFGKGAGYRRNEEMAKYADAAIIIHKDASKGTQHMKDLAEKYKLKLHYVEVKDRDVFSLASLKELQKQLEGKQFVGGDLARKLLDQQIKQLTEYQAVIRDCKTMIEILQQCIKDFKGYNELSVSNDTFSSIEKSLNSPTSKFIQSLNENNK